VTSQMRTVDSVISVYVCGHGVYTLNGRYKESYPETAH